MEVRVPGESEIRAKREEFHAFFCRSEHMDLFRKLGEQKEGKTLSIATITATRSTRGCKDLEATRSGEDYGNGQ